MHGWRALQTCKLQQLNRSCSHRSKSAAAIAQKQHGQRFLPRPCLSPSSCRPARSDNKMRELPWRNPPSLSVKCSSQCEATGSNKRYMAKSAAKHQQQQGLSGNQKVPTPLARKCKPAAARLGGSASLATSQLPTSERYYAGASAAARRHRRQPAGSWKVSCAAGGSASLLGAAGGSASLLLRSDRWKRTWA